jgi:hypothetical protein
MNHPNPMLIEPPTLSDQAAAEMLDFLYELINTFEYHYGPQIRRYHEPPPCNQCDLFENIDGNDPPF